MHGRVARQYRAVGAGLLVTLPVCAQARPSDLGPTVESPPVACEDPRLSVDPQIPARFRAAVEQACLGLKAMTDVDAGVRLSVEPNGDDVVVRARLSVGRTAERHVQMPEALEPTVEALAVVLPVRSTPTTSTPPGQPTSAPEPREQHPAPAPPPQNSRPPFTFELGAAVGGHVAGSPTVLSPSLSGYAGLRSGDWLLAVTVRWDPVQVVPSSNVPGLETDAAGGGFMLTRRLEWDAAAVDVGAAAGLMVQSQSYQTDQGEKTGSAVDARLGLAAQCLLGHQHRRLLLSFNGELSPTRLRRKIYVFEGLPPLPTWDLGFGIGAAWGEP